MNSERIRKILELRNKRGVMFECGKYKGVTFDEVFKTPEGRKYMRYIIEGDPEKTTKIKRDLIRWLEIKAENEHHRTDFNVSELLELYLFDEFEPQCPEHIKFKFGKHKDKTIGQVYEEDLGYINFMLEKNDAYHKIFLDDRKRKPEKENWFIHQICLFLYEGEEEAEE